MIQLKYSAQDLSVVTGGKAVIRDNNLLYTSIATLNSAGKSDLAVFHKKKYTGQLKSTKAGLVILEKKYMHLAPPSVNLIVNSNPYKAFALIAQKLHSEKTEKPYISDKAIIGSSVTIKKNVTIKAGAVIDNGVVIDEGCVISENVVITNNVTLGKNCKVAANVTISNAVIGDNAVIYPGARIGQDGFGFASDESGHYDIPHLGKVMIGVNVTIGANTCIDRGTMDDTRIDDGCRIDNLVQIGHNVKIGRNTVIVAQVGIAGSAAIGKHVTLAGQVGVIGHLKVADKATVLVKSCVLRDVAENQRVAGHPAVPYRQWARNHLESNKNNGYR